MNRQPNNCNLSPDRERRESLGMGGSRGGVGIPRCQTPRVRARGDNQTTTPFGRAGCGAARPSSSDSDRTRFFWSTRADRDLGGGHAGSRVRCNRAADKMSGSTLGPRDPGGAIEGVAGAARARSGGGRAPGQRRRSGPSGCRWGACRGWRFPHRHDRMGYRPGRPRTAVDWNHRVVQNVVYG